MNRISAAEHHLIEFDETVWALMSYVESGDTAVEFEARAEEPLTFSSEFASSHRLPMTQNLPLNFVWQVVLGWSADDDAWHLGLLLATDLASARGSRWCELARWPDPDPHVFADLAEEAARGLSMVIGCPLNVVSLNQPKQQVPTPETQPAIPLPFLPIDLGGWELLRNSNGILQLKRDASWKRSKLLRIGWYILWLVVYLILSILTITSDLALPNAGAMLPNPSILPYLGLVVALILLGMIAYHLRDFFRQPDRFVFDGRQGRVIAMRARKRRWVKLVTELQGIFITEVVNRHGDKHTVYEQALNLYLNPDGFQPLVQQEDEHQVSGVSRSKDEPLDEAVFHLTRQDARSDAQIAGLYITEELGNLPCYYDRRTR